MFTEYYMLEIFNKYMNDYESGTEVNRLKLQCLESARTIIEQKLGYSLELDDYIEESFTNIYNDYIVLKSPCTSLISLYVDDTAIDTDDVVIDRIYLKIDGYYNYKNLDIDIIYESGWDEESLPDEFIICLCEIASLLYLQTNKNIGITSIIAPDGLGRTFINYTNFDKYFVQLRKWMRL